MVVIITEIIIKLRPEPKSSWKVRHDLQQRVKKEKVTFSILWRKEKLCNYTPTSLVVYYIFENYLKLLKNIT